MSHATLIPYERLITACPVLLWALERKWTASEAARKGFTLEASENSAWLILSGKAQVSHAGVTHTAGPGQWMFPKPGKRTQEFSGEFHFLSITIRWCWPSHKHLFDNGLTRTVDSADLPWLETAARDLIRQVAEITAGGYYLISLHSIDITQAAQLYELAGKWAHCFAKAMAHLNVAATIGTTHDPRIAQLLRELRGHDAAHLLDRKQLASSIGVSPRQADRMLKEATGKTLAENLDAMRFDRACTGLLELGLRVKEVASSCGFSDLPTFSRWFKNHADCSPRDYRARYAE